METDLNERRLRQFVQSAKERVTLRDAIRELEATEPTLTTLLENFE